MKKTTIFIIIAMSFSVGGMAGCKGQIKKGKASENKPKITHNVKKADYLFGKVKETMDSGGYTYILLEYKGKATWVAVPAMKVTVGQELMLRPGQVMKNFHSNSLNRTFETIIFSQGPLSPSNPHETGAAQEVAIKAHSTGLRMDKKDVKIEPAKGKGAITVKYAYEKAKELSGKQVVLNCVAVKVSKNILGKNWIHCQDGTGTRDGNNYDITVTTKAAPKVGEKLSVRGILHKDRDIGAGYFYPVLIEEANVTVLDGK